MLYDFQGDMPFEYFQSHYICSLISEFLMRVKLAGHFKVWNLKESFLDQYTVIEYGGRFYKYFSEKNRWEKMIFKIKSVFIDCQIYFYEERFSSEMVKLEFFLLQLISPKKLQEKNFSSPETSNQVRDFFF